MSFPVAIIRSSFCVTACQQKHELWKITTVFSTSLATETSRSLEFWGDFYVTSHPDYHSNSSEHWQCVTGQSHRKWAVPGCEGGGGQREPKQPEWENCLFRDSYAAQTRSFRPWNSFIEFGNGHNGAPLKKKTNPPVQSKLLESWLTGTQSIVLLSVIFQCF